MLYIAIDSDIILVLKNKGFQQFKGWRMSSKGWRDQPLNQTLQPQFSRVGVLLIYAYWCTIFHLEMLLALSAAIVHPGWGEVGSHFTVSCPSIPNTLGLLASPTHRVASIPISHWVVGIPNSHWVASIPNSHWVASIPNSHWVASIPNSHWVAASRKLTD